MDIRNIYEKFSSSVSEPNIVEHFADSIKQIENEDVYDRFINKLIDEQDLSETEKKSLLRIKDLGDDKKELLFNYLMGLFNIYTNNIQTIHVKKVTLEARKKEQLERLEEVGTTFKQSQGLNETVKREIQANDYKFDSINYDLDILKITLIGIGALTIIPVIGFFKLFSKNVSIILWIITLLGFGGYVGYSYYMKNQRDPNNFDKYKFGIPNKNQVSGHTKDPNYEGIIDPKDASVGKVDKYVNEVKHKCEDGEDTTSPSVTTTSTPTPTPTTESRTKPVCKKKSKEGDEDEDAPCLLDDDKVGENTDKIKEKLNEIVELIKQNYMVCFGALGSIILVIIIGVFLYKRTNAPIEQVVTPSEVLNTPQ